MGALQPWHIIVVVLVFLILFGSKKLPDAARGLGRSLRIFKSEVSELHEEESSSQERDEPVRELPRGAAGRRPSGAEPRGEGPVRREQA